MARSDRKENSILREYLYQFIPEQIDTNRLFSKVYGEKFAAKKIKENVLVVYSNEPYSVSGTGAYHNGSEKSITFCCGRSKMDNLLTPDEIAKDKDLQETAVHESIHAILERTREECKTYNISSGTGLLEKYYYSDGTRNEIGRGLNEGFTEWLCEKLGFKSLAYSELTNFVRLIEMAIGTEKTMELGKGGTRTNFLEILNMTVADVNYLLTISDQLYSTNNHLMIEKNIVSLLNRYHDKERYDGREKENIQKEYNDNLGAIEEYKQDPAFRYYVKSNNLEATEDSLLQYLKEQSIPELEEQRAIDIVSFESFLLDKFFVKDLQQIFGNEEISDENFEKLAKLGSILNTMTTEVPENIKNMRPPMSAVVFKEEFEKLSERYIKQLASRDAEKFKKGELGLKQIIEKNELVYSINRRKSDIFLKELAKAIVPEGSSPDLEYQLKVILEHICRFSDSKEYLNSIASASIYQLVSTDSEKNFQRTLLYDQENFLDRYYRKGSIFHEVNEDYEFDFTLGRMEDEYEVAMKNFLQLQREVFSRNPNAKIHIASRTVIVQDRDKTEFYEIEDGELVPMQIEHQIDLGFVYDENGQDQEQEQTALALIKVSRLARFLNRFKRKMNDLRNRGKVDTPNYTEEIEGKIVFDVPKKDKIDEYRINDFDERLAEKRENAVKGQETIVKDQQDRESK